ncbi:MAG: Gfo/Idh/MocA family oxidoreductase [Pseudomonadota bacterium]
MNMTKKLRVGVIGSGCLGAYHAQKYSKMEHVELAGVVDVYRDKAEHLADKCNTKAFFDYRDLIGKIDAASIVTQTPAHFEISKAFLENGIDLLIEKPITTSVDEADALIDIAQKKELIIQSGHLERFNPAIVALEGLVNNPRFFEAHRMSIYQPRGTDVHVVLDLMIHDIDIALHFAHADIFRIDAIGASVISPLIDIANARILFSNGCAANITASRISTKVERKFRIFQQDIYASADCARRELTVISKGENQTPGCVIPGMSMTTKAFPGVDPLEDEIKSFVHSVLTREPPVVSGTDGKKALEVALEIISQIEQGWKQNKI